MPFEYFRKEDSYPVSPELLALFLFVVVGSAVFQVSMLKFYVTDGGTK
jgi:hypothetical protein